MENTCLINLQTENSALEIINIGIFYTISAGKNFLFINFL